MAMLRRISDGAGDSGSRVEAWLYDGVNEPKVIGNKPIVGTCLLVGSVTARTMQWQDHWRTSPITEIISDDGKICRFKTGNSEYEFRY